MENSSTNTKVFIQKLHQGEWDEALAFANQLSQKDPDDHMGYAMLGDALKQKGEFEKATSFYRFALQKKPDQPGLYLALGEAYMLIGENGKALDSYSRALYLDPENIEILQKTGNFLIMAGYLEEARQVLEKSIALGSEKAISSLLDLHIYQGEKPKIQQYIDQHKDIILKHKGDIELARAEYSLGRHQNTIHILKSLDIANHNEVWKRSYFNLLASAYEKMGDYQQAFKHYELQNNQTKKRYNPKKVEQGIYSIVHEVQKMQHLSPQDGDFNRSPFSPLFILGLPRSGTSLLEQILNTSTHVVTGGELLFIEAAYKKYIQEHIDLAEVAAWYRDKLAIITKNQRVPKTAPRWVTDKLPSNFMYLGFIKKLIPDARFLYCHRNPMDNGLSIYKQNFLDTHSYASQQQDIAQFIALERQVMQLWKSEFSDDIYTVNYESLVTDFDSESQKIYQYCDLHWTDQVRNFHKNPAFCNTASFDQIRQPVNANSVGLSKNYSVELEPLKRELDILNVI